MSNRHSSTRHVIEALVSLTVIVALFTCRPRPHADAGTWWVPSLGNQPWQWELSHPLSLTNAQDMGTHDTLPNGHVAPAPVIYDIDGIINSACHGDRPSPCREARRLLHRGRSRRQLLLGCRRGSLYDLLRPTPAAGEFGRKVPGYPEYYLNIQSPKTVSIIESMIDKQCAGKGFDAVETDIDEEYTETAASSSPSRSKSTT